MKPGNRLWAYSPWVVVSRREATAQTPNVITNPNRWGLDGYRNALRPRRLASSTLSGRSVHTPGILVPQRGHAPSAFKR